MKTKIISVAEGSKAVAAASAILSKGGVVVYPTETSYAIGCDATNARAVKKIFSLKGREKNKPLPVIVASVKTAQKYAVLTQGALALCKKFMPGPLTLVVEMKKGTLPSSLSNGGVAFRISSNSFANSVARKLSRPIVSTSANLSGQPSIYSSVQLAETYLWKIEAIVDAGELAPVRASTIVDLRGKNPLLLRDGPIPFTNILKLLTNPVRNKKGALK